MECSGSDPPVQNITFGCRILQENPECFFGEIIGFMVADNDVEAQGFGAGLHNGNCLWMAQFRNEKRDFRAALTCEGAPLASFTHEKSVTVRVPGPGKLEMKVEGSGRCFFTRVRRGVPVGGAAEQDCGVKVRRRLLDVNGSPLPGNTARRGSTVVVEISLESDRDIPNLVVTDMLCAGLEIENTRLTTRDGISFERQPTLRPEHIDMRDDRMIFFARARGGADNTCYYAARAVTCGGFSLPPVAAECMYDENISSVNGAGRFLVTE